RPASTPATATGGRSATTPSTPPSPCSPGRPSGTPPPHATPPRRSPTCPHPNRPSYPPSPTTSVRRRHRPSKTPKDHPAGPVAAACLIGKPATFNLRGTMGRPAERPVPRRLIELSHQIRHGMVTYPGLPGPELSDYLPREASPARYGPGTEFHL